MEVLEEALFVDKVPDAWMAKAYPSNLGLAAWFSDLQLRQKELEGSQCQKNIFEKKLLETGFFSTFGFFQFRYLRFIRQLDF